MFLTQCLRKIILKQIRAKLNKINAYCEICRRWKLFQGYNHLDTNKLQKNLRETFFLFFYFSGNSPGFNLLEYHQCEPKSFF